MHSKWGNVAAQIGDGCFIGGGGNGRWGLVAGFAGNSAAIAAHAFEDSPGEGVAVGWGGDEFAIHRMVHEATFEEHAGNADVAYNDEARALDTPVSEAHVAEH